MTGIPEEVLEEPLRVTRNANILPTPEVVSKIFQDKWQKRHFLKHVLDSKTAQAHLEGYIHIHDLDYALTRSNCCQHDCRWVLKYGLYAQNPIGRLTCVSKPAKHSEVAVLHILKWLMTSQNFFAGGQGQDFVNFLVAPYIAEEGLSYEEVRQLAQIMTFEATQDLVARGGQPAFTNVNLELSCPDFLEDEPAVGPGGKIVGTYGDFEEEAIMFARALLDVQLEGDAAGAPLKFPQIIVKVRPGYDRETLELAFEVAAENGAVYFANMLNRDWRKLVGENVNYMGCRTCLATNWTGDWKIDTIRTGNFEYVTLNLPLLAHESRDEDEFLEKISDYCEIAREALLARWRCVKKCLEAGLYDGCQRWKPDGEYYFRYEHTTWSLGFVGLAEAIEVLTGYGFWEDHSAMRLAERVLEELNDVREEFHERDGRRWSVVQSPAESAAERLARKYLEKYPDARVRGTERRPYLTNSCHVPYDEDVNVVERAEIEARFHPMTLGGHITHFWLGERTDPRSLMKLTVRVLRRNTIGFLAITMDYSVCDRCQRTYEGVVEQCPECGRKCTIWSRVTGYLAPVDSFVDGKKQEHKERLRHEL
ncbi:anaerobic ribonucleoside-triphosphate reductase [Methanopyrus sp.]